MPELPPYNAAAKCAKCGFDRVSSRWCAKAEKQDSICADMKPHVEHMVRFCRRCAFAWMEACMDKEKKR
jgi:hypothetical protein